MIKVCRMCGREFRAKGTTASARINCSRSCMGKFFAAYPTRAPDPARRETIVCSPCGQSFTERKSRGRRFCSYACFLKSGGPQRAGAAATMARKKYGAKKDANHDDIVDALKGVGVQVMDTSAVGGGLTDLILMWRGETYFMEVKNPKTAYGRRGLNKLQKEFAAFAGGAGVKVHVVETVAQALAVFGARMAA